MGFSGVVACRAMVQYRPSRYQDTRALSRDRLKDVEVTVLLKILIHCNILDVPSLRRCRKSSGDSLEGMEATTTMLPGLIHIQDMSLRTGMIPYSELVVLDPCCRVCIQHAIVSVSELHMDVVCRVSEAISSGYYPIRVNMGMPAGVLQRLAEAGRLNLHL